MRIDEAGKIWKTQKWSRTRRAIDITPIPADRLRSDGYLQVLDVLQRPRAQGEGHPKHKLTLIQVEAIRARGHKGETTRALGLEFGVSHVNIRKIISGHYWKNRQFPKATR